MLPLKSELYHERIKKKLFSSDTTIDFIYFRQAVTSHSSSIHRLLQTRSKTAIGDPPGSGKHLLKSLADEFLPYWKILFAGRYCW